MVESRVLCSNVTLAVEWQVVAAPIERASSTATWRPTRASSNAVTRPVNPAPTMTSSYSVPDLNQSVSTAGEGSSQTEGSPSVDTTFRYPVLISGKQTKGPPS